MAPAGTGAARNALSGSCARIGFAKRGIWPTGWRTAPDLGTQSLFARRPRATTFKVSSDRPEAYGAGTACSMRMTLPNAVADAVIDALRREGHDLLLTEGEVFFYGDGVWRVIAGAEQQWLQTLIQREFETLGGSAKPWHLSATWKRITEHPELHQRRVPWESNGRLATANGVLDVVGRTLCPHSPSHYARRKIRRRIRPWCRVSSLPSVFGELVRRS